MFHVQAPSGLNAVIVLPPSKSISNRALILNALCDFPKSITNLSDCDDTKVVVKALRDNKCTIDVGAAGTAMRFLTAFLAGRPGNYLLTGTERMKNRPVKILVDSLRTIGANIEYLEKEGYPPLHITGQSLKGGEIELDGSISSQYISALLMMAPTMTNGLCLHLTGTIISMPYINLTIQLMAQFGVLVFKVGNTFSVLPQRYESDNDFIVESDWSAASYWYEMVALCKNRNVIIELKGLWPDSQQGDAAISDLFDRLGVKTSFNPSGITLMKKQRTVDYPLNFDFKAMPDMAQTVAVTCAALHIPFHFTGLQSLRIKETDRLLALKTELRKLGYLLDIKDEDALVWNGGRCEAETSPVIATYKDHRMAMAFTPVSLCMDNGIRIDDPHVISKSYPSFWTDLEKANFVITEI